MSFYPNVVEQGLIVLGKLVKQQKDYRATKNKKKLQRSH